MKNVPSEKRNGYITERDVKNLESTPEEKVTVLWLGFW